MYRRVFLTSLATPLLLAACAGGLGPVDFGPDENTMDATLIVLRHAEGGDDGLNADGNARAEALAEAMAGVEIDGIYSASQSGIETARPLAQAKEIQIQVIVPVEIARTMFTRQPGRTLVWVGSDADLATLWKEIGADGAPPANPGEMFIVPMTGLTADGVSRSQIGA